MGGWSRRVRIGLVAATVVAGVTTGLLVTQAPTAEAAECFERQVGAPIVVAGTGLLACVVVIVFAIRAPALRRL